MIKKIYCKLLEFARAISDWGRFRKLFKGHQGEKFIILISHSGDTGGGAPVVLYELAKSLNKSNNVIFLTHGRGKIIDLCKKQNIGVFETSFLYRKYLKQIKANSEKIDFMVINTAVLHFYLSYLEKLKFPGKVIWWIHESNDLVNKYQEYIREYNLKHFRICCVSPLVKASIRDACQIDEDKLSLLPYGIVDKGALPAQNRIEPFIISLIGRIDERKNQIELVQAYKKLPSSLQKKIRLLMVAGSCDEGYLRKLTPLIEGQANIKIIGPVPRDKMQDIYSKSNLIVCTSKNDPLPVVITEAMMYGRLFITSNETGQALIAEKAFADFIYESGDTDELARIIERICTHYNGYNDFYVKERQLYLSDFSISGAVNNLREIVKEMD